MRCNRSETGGQKQCADGLALRMAMLDQQRAAGLEMSGRTGRKDPKIVKAIGPRYQRRTRLKAQIASIEVRVVLRDIRGIRDDEIEAPTGERGPPRAFDKDNVGKTEALCVRLRNGQRRAAHVGGDEPRARSCRSDRKCDCARAGAEIGYLNRAVERNPFERKFDQQFGFRTRDQHRGRDHEFERVEAASANEVGDRLTSGATRHKVLEAG